MKKLILLSGIFGFIVLQGCSNDNSKNNTSGENSTEQSQINTNAANADSSQPAIIEQAVEIPAAESGVPAVAATAAGMNPEHGQPGHRCDIAVGAPLNSPPGKPQEPTIINVEPDAPGDITISEGEPGQSPTIQNSPSIPVPPPGPTAPGMNPPHGQPGHDCAIAVGAPLKKK